MAKKSMLDIGRGCVKTALAKGADRVLKITGA